MLNRFYRIKLPEYLLLLLRANASCRRFRPGPLFLPVMVLSFRMAANRRLPVPQAAYQKPGCRVWYLRFTGALPRCRLVWYHIWNVPFQTFKIGDYTTQSGQAFHGDIPRYMALISTRRRRRPAASVQMYGLRLRLPPLNRKTAQSGLHRFRRADLVLLCTRAYLPRSGADPVHCSRDSGRSGIPDSYPAGDM